MAEGHGGPRTPSQPAAVSGPGALSQRTDGGATQAPMMASGGAYGERTDMQGIQSGAALAGGGGGAPAPADLALARGALTPLDAESARPGEDIRTGIDSVPSYEDTEMSEATRERARRALPTLLWLASRPDATEQTRQFVRQIRADA